MDLTAPWERPKPDAAASATGGYAVPDGLDGGGTGGMGGSGPIDVALAKDAAQGGGGGGIDLGAGGQVDSSAIDAPAVGDGGIDAPMDVVRDLAIDLPISGTGGAGSGGAVDAGTGGKSTGGSGGGTGRGGSGGTATGGATGSGGSGGTSTGTGGSTTTCVPPVANSGPVAHYACDSATGTGLPDSAGGKPATLAADALDGGTAYSFGPGRVANALYLSAPNKAYATLPTKLLMNACEATVATWVYLNTATKWQRIFDFGKNDQIYMFLTPQNDGTRKVMRFAISTTGNGSGEQTIDAQAALPTGAWHHVAVVLGPAGGVLYLDGAQAGANAALTLRPADLGNIPNYYIGKSQFTWDPYLDGNVDEIRLYTRALSATEIQTLASGS